MSCLGNVLWFLCCGLYQAWPGVWRARCGASRLWGIPVGLQCFKLAGLSFFPFGKEVRYGGGAGSFLLNLVWGDRERYPAGAGRRAERGALCVTVVGIPFGLQCFKLAKLAFMPFGSEVVS